MPILERWVLDLDSGSLLFIFSETINTSSFDPFTVILSNQSMLEFSSFLILTGGFISENSERVSYNLTTSDLNKIKYISNLCVDTNSCYINLSNYTLNDMNFNQLTPTSLQLYIFIPDTTQPRVISFSLNLNSSILSLSFSETVNASSFIISAIIISDFSGIFHHRLSTSYASGKSSPNQVIQLSNYDINSIKENINFATSRINTFLSVEGYLVADMSGNLVETSLDSSRLECSIFIPDLISPMLVSSHLDMDTGAIHFIFSEPVIASNFRPNEFVIRNNISLSTFYRLSGGYTDVFNRTEVHFYMTDFDLNNIKSDLNLASNISSSYYSYSSQLITDMNFNGVYTVSIHYLNKFSNYSPDITSPRLVSFSINMIQETLELTFNEPVLPKTLNPSRLMLLDPLFITKLPYSLISSFLVNTTVSIIQLVQFGLTDINELKSLEILSPNSISFGVLLFFTQLFVNDTNNNPITSGPIPPIPIICLNEFTEECLNVSLFFTLSFDITLDPYPPTLVRWDLNLTSEEIHLFFSETVIAQSIDISKIRLQDSFNITDSSAPTQFSFTSNTTLTSLNTGPVIILSIGIGDLNDLKAIPTLATCLKDDAYLSLDQGAITDSFNHTNTVITADSALNVTICFRDNISPSLRQFNFYFSDDKPPLILQLIFSETMNSSSLDSTQITFGKQLDFSSDFSSVYSLTENGFSDSLYSNILNISISNSDLTAIRNLNSFLIGIDINKTFLALTATTVKDMQNNFLLPILNTSSLMVSIDCYLRIYIRKVNNFFNMTNPIWGQCLKKVF